MDLLLVGAGGFLGSIARYIVGGLVQRRIDGFFPGGTLAVNTLGCLLIGVMMSVVEDRQAATPPARLFVMVGLLGGFTTFSAFGYETVELLRHGSLRDAALNVAGHLVLGLAAVGLGFATTRALSG